MKRILSSSRWFLAAAVLLLACACSKVPFFGGNGEDDESLEYVNIFAYNVLRTYYLWVDEIRDELNAWKVSEPDPVAKVESLRYKDANGQEVDRWTALYDDYNEVYSYMTGNRKSYGFNLKFYAMDEAASRLVAVVLYTYAESPARNAGLKRGDVIWEVNGQTLTTSNYSRIASEELQGGDQVTLTLGDGSQTTLTAVEMYDNPVHYAVVFDLGKKKAGYLHYTNFTPDSCQELIEVCKYFKSNGISDLILDLRYNTGGYAFVEEVLASMLAPEADVAAGSVLSTEVYNSRLTEALGDTKTCLGTRHSIKSGGKQYEFNTEGANLGISHLYAIVDNWSASASESLLCDLFPYLDITLVGRQTGGKFCSGLLMRASAWYEENAEELGDKAKGKDLVTSWGGYVMYSRFADKYGVTRCMPDGLTPDYEVKDNPLDGYEIGDPRETMLAATLALASGMTPDAAQLRSRKPVLAELPLEQPAFRIVAP